MIPNFDDPYQPTGDCYIEYLLVNGVNKPLYYPFEMLLAMSCQWEGNVSDNYENFSYVFAQEPEIESVEEPVEEPVEDPIEEPIEEPVEEPTEEPVEEPVEEPDDDL